MKYVTKIKFSRKFQNLQHLNHLDAQVVRDKVLDLRPSGR